MAQRYAKVVIAGEQVVIGLDDVEIIEQYDIISAYLTGPIYSTSSVSAFLRTPIPAQGRQAAYMEMGTIAESSVSAYMNGEVINIQHADILAKDTHVASYVQASDPGAVGAGIQWVDTNLGTGNWILKIRNAADTGWESNNDGPGMSRIVARAGITTGFTISTTPRFCDWNGVTVDPESTITTGTDWKWTAPYDCIAIISWSLLKNEKSVMYAFDFVNGALSQRHYASMGGAINNYWCSANGSSIYVFDEGDYWQLRVHASAYSGSSNNGWSDFEVMYFAI